MSGADKSDGVDTDRRLASGQLPSEVLQPASLIHNGQQQCLQGDISISHGCDCQMPTFRSSSKSHIVNLPDSQASIAHSACTDLYCLICTPLRKLNN